MPEHKQNEQKQKRGQPSKLHTKHDDEQKTFDHRRGEQKTFDHRRGRSRALNDVVGVVSLPRKMPIILVPAMLGALIMAMLVWMMKITD